MSSKDKSKESKERDTVTNRRESVGWSKGPSLEVIPAAAKHAPAWGAGHVFERVAVDGRTELAAASGEELRGGGVSTGWADPQTNNVTGYAINPELQLDPNLRAHGGWRGHLACQRDTPEYEIATRIISNAAQITAEIRHEPDCLDCNWRWRDRNSLLKLLLTGAEGILSEEDADNLCTLATACGQVLRDQETVVDVPAPCKVFGDTHGQLRSLLLLFGAFGFPHHGAGDVQATSYIFNGDFVDRGLHQLEVVAILFALKLMYPERVYLLRGNHEFRDMNEKMGEDGFLSHCESRLGAVTPGRWGRIYDAIHASFDLLPLAARIGGAVLVLHGGVGDGSWDLDTLQSIKRPLQELEWDEEASKKIEARAVLHAMWSDPSDSDAGMRAGVHLGQRGGSIPEFGPDITKRFCERNGVEVVIRSHQFVKEGFKLMHSGHLLTVFSARDYFVDTDLFDRDVGNDAALLLLAPDRNGDLRIHPKRISSCVSGIEAAVRKYRRNSGGSAWTRAFAWLVTCGASSRSTMR